jgi:hypothetical protein
MDIQKFSLRNKDGEYIYKETTIDFRIKKLTTISIGDDDTYCMVVKLDSTSPNIAYIDRVEYDSKCSLAGLLKRTVGIPNLVVAGLWTILNRYPSITIITLKDDSHINCEDDSKMYKLSLSYEYILKYNQTWYQKLFQATLPEPILQTFTESLRILDQPLYPFEYMLESGLHYLSKYKDMYIHSTTPRDFISNLRSHYDIEYCKEVCKWITQYIEFLGIKLYYDLWYILPDTLPVQLENYSLTQYIQKGGTLRKTRRHRKSRKHQINIYSTAPTVGTYRDFMNE